VHDPRYNGSTAGGAGCGHGHRVKRHVADQIDEKRDELEDDDRGRDGANGGVPTRVSPRLPRAQSAPA
jgi:hypothetical protein